MRVFGALLILASVTGCHQTSEANRKVAESNAAMEDAKKLESDGIDAATEARGKFPSDQEASLAPAKTCVEKLAEAALKVDVAAKLLKEAADLKLDATFGNYLSLMAQADTKIADRIRAMKSFCDAVAARPGQNDFDAAFEKANKDATTFSNEASDFIDQADKLRRENPSKFDQ